MPAGSDSSWTADDQTPICSVRLTNVNGEKWNVGSQRRPDSAHFQVGRPPRPTGVPQHASTGNLASQSTVHVSIRRAKGTYKAPPNMSMLGHAHCSFGYMMMRIGILSGHRRVSDEMNRWSMRICGWPFLLDTGDGKVCLDEPESFGELGISKNARIQRAVIVCA